MSGPSLAVHSLTQSWKWMAWTLMTLFRIPNRWYHLRHHNYDFRESAECMHCMNLLISKRGPAGTAFCQEDPHLLKEWLTWCCSGKNPLVEQWFFGIQCQTRELRPVRAHPTNHLKKNTTEKQPGCTAPPETTATSPAAPTRLVHGANQPAAGEKARPL